MRSFLGMGVSFPPLSNRHAAGIGIALDAVRGRSILTASELSGGLVMRGRAYQVMGDGRARVPPSARFWDNSVRLWSGSAALVCLRALDRSAGAAVKRAVFAGVCVAPGYNLSQRIAGGRNEDTIVGGAAV